MKLKTQIIAFGLAGAVASAASGGIGLVVANRLCNSMLAVMGADKALAASLNADMMHDALRGDALSALVGSYSGEPEPIKEAQQSLVEHRKRFEEALATVEALKMTAATETALTEVRPLVKRYIDSVQRVVDAAATDPSQSVAAMPSVHADFVALEDKMEALSESIEVNATGMKREAQVYVQQAIWQISIAMALAALGVVVGGLALARRMTRPMEHAVDVANRIAEGDLGVSVRSSGNDETKRLLESMARMQQSVSAMVGNVITSAQDVATSSAEIAAGNQDLSDRTERQASSLQQTAATMEELGTTVRLNAESAQQASQLARGASEVAMSGGQVMGQVVQTMSDINDSSRRIAEILGVIDSIAFQTNILALNAAVEAARAGEQGRGFAVVASEVRTLAQRSASAAREIKSLVGASVDRVGQGSTLVDQAGKTMAEIVTAIQRVTDIVSEITSASAEQSAGVTQVGQAVSDMDRTTQQNAAAVEQVAAAASRMSDKAQQLVQSVALFKRAGVAA